MEQRIPNWIRLIILISAVMKIGFATTLLIDPSQIKAVWPWPLPALSARLLGASTLVSVTMGILVVVINRYALVMIPLVMMATYRVLQLTAGFIHFDRFDLTSPMAINYFGGGGMMLALFVYVVWAGQNKSLPAASTTARFPKAMGWQPGGLFGLVLMALAAIYVCLGVAFLFLGAAAKPMWIDSAGMTPLTARLFSSPLIGLGLGLFLISRSRDWRAVMIPAMGLLTIGLSGCLALALELDSVVVRNVLGGLVVTTPLVLAVVGAVLLRMRPKTAG